MGEQLLVIEDEALVRDLVVLNLRHAGYAVASAATFAEGRAALKVPGLSLAVVDVQLPGGEGFQLVREARDAGLRCPVLMLTARSETQSKIRGLDCGADDYLTKPFDVLELLARIRALLRRASGDVQAKAKVLTLGAWWVRFDTGQALTREGTLTLGDKELRLMELFDKSHERLLSRAEILEEVWGADSFPSDRLVDDFVHRLRGLFEPDPSAPKYLLTVGGRGFQFRRPD